VAESWPLSTKTSGSASEIDGVLVKKVASFYLTCLSWGAGIAVLNDGKSLDALPMLKLSV